MKSALLSLVALFGLGATPEPRNANSYPRKTKQRKEDDLPRYRSGAKLARKALKGTVGRAVIR